MLLEGQESRRHTDRGLCGSISLIDGLATSVLNLDVKSRQYSLQIVGTIIIMVLDMHGAVRNARFMNSESNYVYLFIYCIQYCFKNRSMHLCHLQS